MQSLNERIEMPSPEAKAHSCLPPTQFHLAQKPIGRGREGGRDGRPNVVVISEAAAAAAAASDKVRQA